MLLRSRRESYSFLFSLIALAVLCFALSEVAKADTKGIPYSDEFPSASYPYARVVAGCTAWRLPAHMTESFGTVSFANACQNHDQCFHTLGATWEACNNAYDAELHAACDRHAAAVPACAKAVDRYVALARDPAARARFRVAQLHELAYLKYVAGVVDGIYRSLLHRSADDKEKSRALATLTESYSLDDLRTVLMGQRIELETAMVEASAD